MYVFYDSKQYFIFYCWQTSVFVFVIFIDREYPYVVW